MQVLNSLGYSHLSPLSAAIIHSGFASQLESHGLWHWSIFVLLHLKDDFARKSAILDMLGRHVELLNSCKLSDTERFLERELNIPLEWIYRAKAVKASCMHQHADQVSYLLKASEWNEAHQVCFLRSVHHSVYDIVFLIVRKLAWIMFSFQSLWFFSFLRLLWNI